VLLQVIRAFEDPAQIMKWQQQLEQIYHG